MSCRCEAKSSSRNTCACAAVSHAHRRWIWQAVQWLLEGRLLGTGNVVRQLSTLGFPLRFEQSALHEFDFSVNVLAVDLRDGIRLCKLTEMLTGALLHLLTHHLEVRLPIFICKVILAPCRQLRRPKSATLSSCSSGCHALGTTGVACVHGRHAGPSAGNAVPAGQAAIAAPQPQSRAGSLAQGRH